MAGFEVIIYGRFWVIAEGLNKSDSRCSVRLKSVAEVYSGLTANDGRLTLSVSLT